MCGFATTFGPPAAGRGGRFSQGLRPCTPFCVILTGEDPNLRFPHERNDLFSPVKEKFSNKKFLLYLFPAKGWVSGSPETRWETRELRRSFRPPAAGRGNFFAGLRPAPLFLRGEDSNLRTSSERRIIFSFSGEFFFYLFPATGRVSGSPESCVASPQLSARLRRAGEVFLAGAPPLHPVFLFQKEA